MTGYHLVAVKRDWVPEWLWRVASVGGAVSRIAPLRRWLTEPVAYEHNGAWWIDR